ncbi:MULTISPECIES: hypothetical protein [Aeromicrobium]|uniref:hypothetical protein n=1 Tax=Aeromicrobium TaxID=2040 RepID=UPI00257C3617|nr:MULTISPECIES: hypothetical protein [Aeromicrobium]
MNSKIRMAGILTGAFVAFGVAGYTFAGATGSDGDARTGSRPAEEVTASKGQLGQDQKVEVRGDGWAKSWVIERGYTADGRTYGSQEDPQYGVPLPDLVATLATNGEVGYTSLKESTRALESLEKNPDPAGIAIPVYAKDGETVVGEYIVGGLIDVKKSQD